MKCIEYIESVKLPVMGVRAGGTIDRVDDMVAATMVQNGHAVYVSKEKWKKATRPVRSTLDALI